MTNTVQKKVAVILPTPRGITAISRVLKGDELNNVLETLKSNKPAICFLDTDISCDDITTTTIYQRYANTLLASHLLGYVDSSGHGVSGLELAYDDILYSDKCVNAIVNTDGKGNVLKGIKPYFENDISQVLDGVVTTIDVNIQSICEQLAAKLDSGCVIVAEANSSKIRAMASVPTFDINNISNSLNSNNSPMLNRALCAYNVGSVFKPCVAAVAIENNYGSINFECKGSLEIGDRLFRCHNLDGHNLMDLRSSLAQSCNCFFYNLSSKIGGGQIYKTASILSLGSKIKLADNMFTANGKLPTKNELTLSGTLANLSIGQGKLVASPIAMLNLYLAIAGNGSYYIPSVVEKTIKNGVEKNYDKGSATNVMKKETAAILRDYLKTVVTEGTGIEASCKYTTCAGKTGTAQTGRYYKNGEEITNSWFCGFFPVESPKYVVVVMSDSRPVISTASIFAQIADSICEYKGINSKINN